ncbi:MAG TPA: hypothetical protein VFW96_15155 [Thermomicrobiales bacterium]|nr:hypothetical protein [Thermomicrobiales bacterium]
MKDEDRWVPVEVLWDAESRQEAARARDHPLALPPRWSVPEGRPDRRGGPPRVVHEAVDRIERRDPARRRGRPRPRHKKLRPRDLDDLA